MLSLTFQAVSWPMLGTALLAFGFAPGAVLRLIVLLFPRDDPRRQELLGELPAVPRIERPFWVIEQLEVGLFEGLRHRFVRRKTDDLVGASEPGEQKLLFNDDLLVEPAGIGWGGPTACGAAGITYRQLDYWARTGLVEPSLRAAQGSGSARLYSFRDILLLKLIKRLLDTGTSLQQIRAGVNHLRSRGASDLAQATLVGDGRSLFECTSGAEVVDLVQGGQGVFGIALGRIWQDIGKTLAELPAEQADDPGNGPPGQ